MQSEQRAEHLTSVQLARLSLHYLRAYRWQKAAVLLTVIVDAAFTLGLYAGLKALIDAVVRGDSHGIISPTLAIVAILLFVVTTLANVAREAILARVEVALANDLRLKMLEHLQFLSPAFYDRVGSTALGARFAGDVTTIKNGLTKAFPTVVRYGLQAVVVVVLLPLFDWRLTVLIALLCASTLVLALTAAARAGRATARFAGGDAWALAGVQEMIAGHRVITAFGAGGALLRDVETRMAAAAPAGMRAGLLNRLVTRTLESGVVLIQFIAAGVGISLVLAHSLSVGALAAVIGLLGVLGAAVVRVALALPEWLGAAGAMQRVDAHLAEQPAVRDAPDAAPLPRIGRDIVFDDVGFAYPGAEFCLRHVNLTIPFGQSVAIVGRNGSGKSTLLSLLLRLWDPREGAIKIDGQDMRAATQESLRAQCGVIFQDTFLLDRSVRENIVLGSASATDHDVEAAARAAHIHDTIMALPRGYATPLGQQGVTLSGGQRQRLALARALLRDPALLVLDEATSALDPAAEAAFGETLWRLPGRRTIIAVTHRLASAVDADRIVVLDAGRLVEQGTHEDLLAAGGTYRQLWDKQAGFVVDGSGRRARVTAGRLRSVPLFAEADGASLAAVAGRFAAERFDAGDAIVSEGEIGDAFYLVVRGTVDVVAARQGTEIRLATLEDGDYFGEIALLADVPRTATVRARTSCLVLALARSHFDDLLRREPTLRASIAVVADARARETTAARAAVQ